MLIFINSNLFEFAFVGRSNCGKSSLINALVNQKKLAKTSSTPGLTKLVNYFLINCNAKEFNQNKQFDFSQENEYLPCLFVDLPGYGYSKAGKAHHELWSNLIEDATWKVSGHTTGGVTPSDMYTSEITNATKNIINLRFFMKLVYIIYLKKQTFLDLFFSSS